MGVGGAVPPSRGPPPKMPGPVCSRQTHGSESRPHSTCTEPQPLTLIACTKHLLCAGHCLKPREYKMKTRQCTCIRVSILKHTDGSAVFPPHLSDTAPQTPPFEQTVLSLPVLANPLLQGPCSQQGHSERCCANREWGEGRC